MPLDADSGGRFRGPLLAFAGALLAFLLGLGFWGIIILVAIGLLAVALA